MVDIVNIAAGSIYRIIRHQILSGFSSKKIKGKLYEQ